jgi:hypothetical protein
MIQLTTIAKTPNGKIGFMNRNQINDFAKNNPDKTIMVTFEVIEGKEGLIKYYRGKVLPEWKQELFKVGIIKRIEEIDLYLKSISPIAKGRSLSDLSHEELKVFMDLVQDVSLQDANLFVENWRCL